jgi:hypothetical protein
LHKKVVIFGIAFGERLDKKQCILFSLADDRSTAVEYLTQRDVSEWGVIMSSQSQVFVHFLTVEKTCKQVAPAKL